MHSENTVTRDLFMYIVGFLLMIVLSVSQDLTSSKSSRSHVYVLYHFIYMTRGAAARSCQEIILIGLH